MARSAKEDPPMNGARWRPLVLAMAAAGALVLAACGEDDNDVPSTTAAPAETTTSAAATTAAATTTTATTVVLIKPGDPCGVYGAEQKAGDQTLYCDGEVWGTTPPPSTTAAPEG
jgi:hypothetical protein